MSDIETQAPPRSRLRLGEDALYLQQVVEVVALDHEEAGQLLHGLGVRTFGDGQWSPARRRTRASRVGGRRATVTLWPGSASFRAAPGLAVDALLLGRVHGLPGGSFPGSRTTQPGHDESSGTSVRRVCHCDDGLGRAKSQAPQRRVPRRAGSLLVTFALCPTASRGRRSWSVSRTGASTTVGGLGRPVVTGRARMLVAVRLNWDYHRACDSFLAGPCCREGDAVLLNGSDARLGRREGLLDPSSPMMWPPLRPRLLDDVMLVKGLQNAVDVWGRP